MPILGKESSGDRRTVSDSAFGFDRGDGRTTSYAGSGFPVSVAASACEVQVLQNGADADVVDAIRVVVPVGISIGLWGGLRE